MNTAQLRIIVAIIMAAPISRLPTPSPPKPSSSETMLITSAPSTPMPSQLNKNTRQAPTLRTQAIRLKNRAFTGGTPCQCTRPGACQNSSDSGSDSTVAVHMAFWKLGSDAICAVTGVPSM